jgi:hypothetical protein
VHLVGFYSILSLVMHGAMNVKKSTKHLAPSVVQSKNKVTPKFQVKVGKI